jgi:hypothetical protein
MAGNQASSQPRSYGMRRAMQGGTRLAGLAAALAAGLGAAGCGNSDARAGAAGSDPAAPPATHERPPELRHEIEVYVEQQPTRPYLVIATYRYAAPRNAGEEIPYLKRQVVLDGGDALLVRVVAGDRGRTDIDQEALIEAKVLAWRQ